MPVTRMPYGRSSAGRGGSGRPAAGSLSSPPSRPRLGGAVGGAARRGAAHGDEARAEAAQARQVVVARALVDLALGAQRGGQRPHRDAVRLRGAVAAAFADGGVDQHARGRRRGVGGALALAPRLGGAGLLVDQHRQPAQLAQLALHRVERVAVVHRRARRQAGVGAVARRVVADDGDAARAFGRDLARDLRHRRRALGHLAAGHRDRAVDQDLVGDVDAGSGGGADRQQPAVLVGAVAEVLEHVAGAAERRDADPVGAFTTHVRARDRAPRRLLLHHAVAADAGHRDAAVGQRGRAVVRAAAAEEGLALGVGTALPREGLQAQQPREPLAEAGVVLAQRRQARHQRLGDARRPQLAGRRQQRRALLVALADQPRALRRRQRVQDARELLLDEGALLLDDQHLLQPARELQRAFALERPGQADLPDPDAERGAGGGVQTELVERLAQVEVGLAAARDAQAVRCGGMDQPVEGIGAREGRHRVQLRPVQPAFLLQRRVGPADVQPARRQLEVRRGQPQPVRVDLDRGRALDRLGHRLETDPAAREARHLDPGQAEAQVLADAGGVQHRHQRGGEHRVALVRQRRRLAAVVVAGDQQHAAARRAAGHLAMLDRVDAAVHARALAVPEREHAVGLRPREQVQLLRAPDRGGGQVLVEAGLEVHAVRIQRLRRGPERAVDAAQRRAPVAADEARGREPGGGVAPALVERQANDRLGAAEVDAAALERIAVVQREAFAQHAVHYASPGQCGAARSGSGPRRRPLPVQARTRCCGGYCIPG